MPGVLLIGYVFIVCVALAVFYLLIKAAVRDGIKEALREIKHDNEDDTH